MKKNNQNVNKKNFIKCYIFTLFFLILFITNVNVVTFMFLLFSLMLSIYVGYLNYKK